MATNRKKKEEQRSSGNGASFGDIERQQREEAQRQIQSVSRVNQQNANNTMDTVIQQQNEEARRQAKSTDNVFNGRDEAINELANIAADSASEFRKELTKEDNRFTEGGDILSEIAAGQNLQALEQAQQVSEALHDAANAGKSYARGAANFGVGVYDASEGWARVHQATESPEDLYTGMVSSKYLMNPANMESYGDVSEGNRYYDEMISGYQNSEVKEQLQNVSDSLANEMSDTMMGQVLENASENTIRSALATALYRSGGAGALVKAASLAPMYALVAGRQMKEDLDAGYTAEQAKLHGELTGLGEVGTEMLDAIPGIRDIPILVNNKVGGQPMGILDLPGEATEEGLNAFLKPYIDIALKDNSDGQFWQNLYDAAVYSVSPENRAQILNDALAGGMSAAFSSLSSNPSGTIQAWQNDLQNLPGAISTDLTQAVNKIRNTNEYEKALNRELVNDPIANSMDAEAQQARKAEIRDRFLSNENLRSEDALTREAAQAANTEYIKEQAKKYGINQNDADRITILSNRSGYMVEFADADQVVDANGKRVNGVHYDDGRIVLSDQSTEPIVAVAAHEIWHEIRGTQEASAFRKFLEAAADSGVLENFTEKYGNVEGLQGKIIPAYGINNIQDA